MDNYANSTIAALCYANKSGMDFQALTSQLAEALWENGHGELDIQSQYDDFVVFDLPTLRICLAYTDLQAEFSEESTNTPVVECIVVSVGSGPNSKLNDPLFQNRAILSQALVDRIFTQSPADEVLRLDRDAMFDSDLHDTLVDDIWRVLSAESATAVEAAQTPVSDEAVVEATAAPTSEAEDLFEATAAATAQLSYPESMFADAPASVEPTKVKPARAAFDPIPPESSMPDLEARFDAERRMRAAAFEARHGFAPPPDPAAAKPANKKPKRKVRKIPHPTHPAMAADAAGAKVHAAATPAPESQVARIRAALYPDPNDDDGLFEDVTAQPLVHRVAIHAMNTSLIAFALPVGAAMLTLTLLGRESMALTTRMTAVTGAAIGIAQSDSFQQVISMFT